MTAFRTAGILASLVFVPGSDPLGTVEQQAKPRGHDRPVPLARPDQRLEAARTTSDDARPERDRQDAAAMPSRR